VIADLKPYGKYKESGLPWLGQVPEHWETRPAFGAFVPNHERNHGMKEKTVLSLSYGRIVIKPAEKLHGLVPESFETYQVVVPGDIVLRTTDLQNDHTSLRVGMVRDRGIVTSAYLALRTSRGVNPEFGFQFLNVWDSSKAIYGYGSGLRQNLDFSHFKRMPVAVPPPDEQAAIVRFLGWANGRLERAIRAKRKVIALLNEQKQAIIHRAVTRGLDPSVPRKPSGIPWLGDIPQHWEVRRLGHAIRLQTGFPFASTGFTQAETGTRLLRGINVTPSGIRWDQAVRWKRVLGDGLDEFALAVGDIALGMDRPIIGSGVRAATIQENDTPSLLLQRVARLRPTDSLDAKFLLLLLRGPLFSDYMAPIFTGISVPHLSPQQIKGFRVPLPSLKEQQAIVSHLEAETSGLDIAVSRLAREIELLREYRTRLVADVVTGKLDVREAAARLPDEAPFETVEDDADLGDEIEAAGDEATV
jgi:type I restriction enzyme S subunit